MPPTLPILLSTMSATEKTSEGVDYVAVLQRQQRRRSIWTIVIVTGVLGAAGLAYMLWPKSADPRCKEDQVRYFLKDKRLPAVAVSGCCRFPQPLTKTLQEMAAAPPHLRKLEILKLSAEAPGLFEPACPTYRRATIAASQALPGKQTAAFLKICDLSKTGIASTDALARAPLDRLLLAMAVYSSLRKSDPKWARLLAREVCCSGRP